MKAKATAYLRDGRLYIVPASETTQHMWMDSGPVQVLELPPDDSETLGVTVADALAHVRRGVPHPQTSTEWNAVTRPLLEAAGVRTWKSFANSKSARCAQIELADDLTVVPSYPSNGGFQFVRERAVRLPSGASPSEIGAAVASALSGLEKDHDSPPYR